MPIRGSSCIVLGAAQFFQVVEETVCLQTYVEVARERVVDFVKDVTTVVNLG